MEIIPIIECVCSVASLIVSIISLFMVTSIKNNVKIKATDNAPSLRNCVHQTEQY